MRQSEDEENDSNLFEEEKTPGCYIKARHVLALMGFFGMFNAYALRSNLSVAIVAMVNTTEDVQTQNETNVCPERGQSSSDPSSNGVFNWNPAQQGLLLGCYYYGYLCNNVLGAWMSRRFGFRLVMGVSMMLSGVITICMPAVAYTSFELLVTLRAVIGFLQGVCSPSIIGAWGVWGPPMERSALTSISISGSSVGTFVTLPVAGLIAESIGWEAIFYVTGGSAVVWCGAWFALVYDSPDHHPRISHQEKKFIVESSGVKKKKDQGIKVTTPWKSILTSLPVIGIFCSHFAGNWGIYTLLSMLPTYMATILRFNLAASGILSALPYFLQWIFTLLGGYFTDVVRGKRLISTVAVRKINTTLGLTVPAIFLVLAGYIGCNAAAAVATLSLSVAFTALIIPGSTANTLDIAPKYAGIIYGISNTTGSIPGFLAPQVVGWLLVDDSSLSQWQTVFWISAAIYLAGNIMYVLLASGQEQSWAAGNVVEQKRIEGTVQSVSGSISTRL